MLFEHTIVGPIHSRRLGHSLGVNLLPLQHKHCSYDCIYCECGWNRESEAGQLEFVTPEQVAQQLEQRLQTLQAEGGIVDSFTFAGNGEPTLYPQFPQIVDIVCTMRDRYFPNAVTTLLTNATQLTNPSIFQALQRLDNPILKLDAGTPAMRRLINRNNELGCTWDNLLDSLVRFGSHGIIQTLLFDGTTDGKPVGNTSQEEFAAYVELLKNIRPRYVMLYALDRATPEKGLRKLTPAQMEPYAETVRKEGIEVRVYG